MALNYLAKYKADIDWQIYFATNETDDDIKEKFGKEIPNFISGFGEDYLITEHEEISTDEIYEIINQVKN